MKGLILSSFYASKKSLITYLIVAIVASFLFAFINPMACFLPMIFLLSPVTDNLKREKILNGCIIFQHCQHIEVLTLKVISHFMAYSSLSD